MSFLAAAGKVHIREHIRQATDTPNEYALLLFAHLVQRTEL